jgi:hypothetical protein
LTVIGLSFPDEDSPMVRLVLLCTSLFGAPAEGTPSPSSADFKAYEAARADVGRDPQGHVKLALWCEAHGLNAERLKHLALAVLIDPTNATARGLMGLVAYRGNWESPEKVAARLKADEAAAAPLAEYNARRAELEERIETLKRRSRRPRYEAARAHDALGVWCKQNGLSAEATAHFTSAVVIDPYFDEGWKHLGYVRHGGSWASPEQVAAEKVEAEARRRAISHWEPLLRKWRTMLVEKDKKDEAETLLEGVNDQGAVPAIVRVFVDTSEAHQQVAARLLGRIDTPESTRELSRLAVLSRFDSVREASTQSLKGRSPRDYVAQLVEMIHAPMAYKVEPVRGPGSPGALLVETPRYQMLRTYDAPPAFQLSNQFYGYVGYDANGLPVVARGAELKQMARESSSAQAQHLASIEVRTQEMLAEANLKAAVSQQRMIADIRDIETMNARSNAMNEWVSTVLRSTADAPDLKNDEDAWHTWWYDKLGYSYEPPAQVQVAVNASPSYPPPLVRSCFAVGTLVRTLDGSRPIESLKVGDQVLSQDVATGALSFQPILVVHHNAPARTLRITMDHDETIVASVYHRFWRAGKGWAQARELNPGDQLRTLGGLSRVVSVTPGKVEPVFNLDVAGSRTFFVGGQGALVHDNTLPDPRIIPFDAEPVLASARLERTPSRP